MCAVAVFVVETTAIYKQFLTANKSFGWNKMYICVHLCLFLQRLSNIFFHNEILILIINGCNQEHLSANLLIFASRVVPLQADGFIHLSCYRRHSWIVVLQILLLTDRIWFRFYQSVSVKLRPVLLHVWNNFLWYFNLWWLPHVELSILCYNWGNINCLYHI